MATTAEPPTPGEAAAPPPGAIQIPDFEIVPKLGLIPVAQLASYHGLWFGTWNEQAPPLESAEANVPPLAVVTHAIARQSAARWMRKSDSSGVGLPVLPFCAPL